MNAMAVRYLLTIFLGMIVGTPAYEMECRLPYVQIGSQCLWLSRPYPAWGIRTWKEVSTLSTSIFYYGRGFIQK